MSRANFARSLEQRIEKAYRARGDRMGWRLLYSPAHVLNGASVAFVGLNPGGDYAPVQHAEFAMDHGSAYEREDWGAAPGQAKLQRQVRALCNRLGVRPEDVLAGNLVPFRSPSWEAMADRRGALAFGKALWSKILHHARPNLVIAMGGVTIAALADVLNVHDLERVNVGWGSVKGQRGRHHNGVFVGLPHLSRFAIIDRPQSEHGLERLLRS